MLSRMRRVLSASWAHCADLLYESTNHPNDSEFDLGGGASALPTSAEAYARSNSADP